MRMTPVLLLAVALSACNLPDPPPTATKTTEARKAQEAAQSIHFEENAEIENIKHRLELTADPGKLGFIVLLNQAGQPILYEGVKGKVTSGGKRLTPTWQWKHIDCGASYCDKDVAAPSDEGTYGQSGEYVFYWNTDGVYRQWSGGYLYSDQPIRLKVEPLVITTTATK